MRGSAEKQCALVLADRRQHQPAQHLLSLPGGGEITRQQAGIELIRHGAHGKGQRTGGLIKDTAGLTGQLSDLSARDGRVARERQIGYQGGVLTSARGLTGRCERQQARYLSGFLAVHSADGEDVEVECGHSVRMDKRSLSLYW